MVAGLQDPGNLGTILRSAEAFGAAGVLLAWSIGTAVDARVLRDGQQLFLFSTRLLSFAVVFSVALGALAAGYATLRIVRLSPAEAIREYEEAYRVFLHVRRPLVAFLAEHCGNVYDESVENVLDESYEQPHTASNHYQDIAVRTAHLTARRPAARRRAGHRQDHLG